LHRFFKAGENLTAMIASANLRKPAAICGQPSAAVSPHHAIGLSDSAVEQLLQTLARNHL